MVQCTFKINDILQLVCHTLYIPITRAFILFPQTPPLSLSLSLSLTLYKFTTQSQPRIQIELDVRPNYDYFEWLQLSPEVIAQVILFFTLFDQKCQRTTRSTITTIIRNLSSIWGRSLPTFLIHTYPMMSNHLTIHPISNIYSTEEHHP